MREKVLACAQRRLPVTEIARILAREGTPVSAQTVWKICDAEGLARLRGDDATARGPATALAPVKAAALGGWPAEALDLPCDHAGLLLLAPAMTEAGLHELIGSAATRPPPSCQPGTRSAPCCWPRPPGCPAPTTSTRSPTMRGWRSSSA